MTAEPWAVELLARLVSGESDEPVFRRVLRELFAAAMQRGGGSQAAAGLQLGLSPPQVCWLAQKYGYSQAQSRARGLASRQAARRSA